MITTLKEPTARIDARPQMVADSRSLWAEAGVILDRFAEQMQRTLDELNIRALIQRSAPGEYPLSLRLVAWELQEETGPLERTTREHLKIAIEPLPFRTRPFRFFIEIGNARRTIKRTVFDQSHIDIDECVEFALSRAGFPRGLRWNTSEFLYRLAERAWPRLARVKGARGEIITWPSGLSIGALILSSIPFYPYTAIIALVMVIVAIVIAIRRPRLYATIRRPPTSPRSLAQVDTWHANLPNAAQEVAEVRARLETALEKLDRQVEQGWESYQIALPYGYERHELLVLTKGQAMVHVKVYNIGTDLLIGWEGYLNWRCWTETAPTASCVQNGERVVFKSVTPALYVPGWSDLSDLTALMESVHVRIVEVVRLLVVERDIKAEIDFSILRGDRSAALNKETARRSTGSSSREAGGWRKLLGASKTT